MEGSTPPADTPREPTPSEAQRIGAAAAEGAAQNPTDPQAGAAAATRAEAERLNVSISEEDCKRIAAMSAQMHEEMLERRGAFDPPPPPAEATTAATPPAGGESQQPPAGGGQPPAAPATPGSDEQPHRKRTFADRLRGT